MGIQEFAGRIANIEFATALIMSPGEVVDSAGSILVHGGCKMEYGSIYLTFAQAQKARPYGWRLLRMLNNNLVVMHRPLPKFYNPAQLRADERKRKRKRKRESVDGKEAT